MGPGLSALLWDAGTALLCFLVAMRWGSKEPSGLLWLWALLVPLSAVGGAVAVLARRPIRPGWTRANVARRLHRRSRPTGQLPPVYPNSWFCLLDSEQLRPGAVRHVSALGEEFAVFRGLDGKAYVVDAYCPHLGANLGVGGQVVGSCIECPFHGWQFRGEDGKCTRIPYAEKVPECAKIKVWPSCEVAGMIAVWYHCDGIDPTWQIPEQEAVSSQEWVFRGITEHFINAHIQEIPENAADTAHLSTVHGPSFMSGADLRYSNSKVWGFFRHNLQSAWDLLFLGRGAENTGVFQKGSLTVYRIYVWHVEWQPEQEPNTHCALLNLKHSLTLFGKHCSLLDVAISARQVGPGLGFYTLKHAYLGHAVVIHSATPVEPLQQHVINQYYCQQHMPALVTKFIKWAEYIQLERDVMVWNNKRYVSNPLLVKEDGPIQKFRHWYSQFYSENSPKLMSHKAPLDW